MTICYDVIEVDQRVRDAGGIQDYVDFEQGFWYVFQEKHTSGRAYTFQISEIILQQAIFIKIFEDRRWPTRTSLSETPKDTLL